MGVLTTCALSEGTLFGPISPSLTLSDPALLIGHRTCDVLPDIHTVKLDVGDHARLGDWVPYVQAARDSAEQNMEVILGDDGLMYFRVTCDVTKNTEVHIWYSEKYATYIGVPEHKDEYLNKGTGRYVCQQCSDSFQYPYCLRAHMRFRCKYRQQQQQQQQQLGGAEVHIKSSPLFKSNHPADPSLLLRHSPPSENHLAAHHLTAPSRRQTHGRRRPCLSGSSHHTGCSSSPSESSLSPLSDRGCTDAHRSVPGDRRRIKRPHSGSDQEVSPSESSGQEEEEDYESDDRSSPKRPHVPDVFRSNNSSDKKQFNSSPSDKRSPDIDAMRSSHSPRVAPHRSRDVIGDLINRHDVMGKNNDDLDVDLKRKGNGHVRYNSDDKLDFVTMMSAEDQARSAFQRVDRKLLSPAPMLSSTSLSTMMTSSSSSSSTSSVLTPTTMLNMGDQRGAGGGGGLGGGNSTGNMLRMLGGGGMMMFPPPPAAHHLALAARGMAPLGPAPHPADGLHRMHHHHHPMGVENSAYYAAAAAAAAAALNGLHYINNNNNNNGAGVNNGGYKNMKLTDNASAAAAAAAVAQMAALPFIYRSPNPMLDKMIHHAGGGAGGRVVLPPVVPPLPTSQTHAQRSVVQSAGFPPMNLAQNWCAKCNTSFRMTSDLVYHMRSHHKREFDPVRKKKDDKLKCDVCGETFRERHHLTRHMTSHT